MPDIPLRNDADPQWQEIHAAAAQEEAGLARVVYAALAALAAAHIMRQIRAALRQHDVETALRAIPVEDIMALATTLEPVLARIAVEGAEIATQGPAVITTTELVARLGTLDQITSQDMQRWARTHAAQMVRAITDETRDAIRKVMVSAVQSGTSPRQTARLIEAIIGLTERQARAVQRYRAALLDGGIEARRVGQMVDRYANRLLRHRARTIARHETLQAANEGRRAVWEREKREGVIDPNRWEREWVAIVPSDGRTCPYCQRQDGQRARIGEPYPDGSMGPPGHVVCRCTEVLRRVA